MLGEIRRQLSEAQICVEAAIVAGQSVSLHGIVPSHDFEQVMRRLNQAAEALDKAQLPESVVLRLPLAARV